MGRRLFRIWKWVAFGLGAYVTFAVGWAWTHEPSEMSVALLLAGLVLTAVVGTVAVPFAFISVVRSFLTRYGGPSKATDGPEADYGEPDPPGP